MRAMFEAHVEPILRSRVREAFYEAEAVIEGIYEATLAPYIEGEMRRSPDVYIKSHPRLEGGVSVIQLHVACRAPTVEEARAKVEEAMNRLLEEVRALTTSMARIRGVEGCRRAPST